LRRWIYSWHKRDRSRIVQEIQLRESKAQDDQYDGNNDLADESCLVTLVDVHAFGDDSCDVVPNRALRHKVFFRHILLYLSIFVRLEGLRIT